MKTHKQQNMRGIQQDKNVLQGLVSTLCVLDRPHPPIGVGQKDMAECQVVTLLQQPNLGPDRLTLRATTIKFIKCIMNMQEEADVETHKQRATM